MKRFAIPLLSLALSACTGVPIPGQGTAQPAPSSTPIIGELDTETEALALINELRTKGTLGGDASVRNGTCATNWTPRQPLAFHGGLHFAARKHADYLAVELLYAQNGEEWRRNAHVQVNPSNPHFYGTSVANRVTRALTEHGFAPLGVMGENVAWEHTPYQAVLAWLRSPAHCVNLMDAADNFGAIGHGLTQRSTGQTVNHWVMKTGS